MRKLFQIIPIPNDSIQRPLWWFDFVSPKWLARKVRAHFQLANIIAQKVRVRITLIHSHTVIQTLISTTHTMAPLKRKKSWESLCEAKTNWGHKNYNGKKSRGAWSVRPAQFNSNFPKKNSPASHKKIMKMLQSERTSERTHKWSYK